jgi:hypothetical protein
MLPFLAPMHVPFLPGLDQIPKARNASREKMKEVYHIAMSNWKLMNLSKQYLETEESSQSCTDTELIKYSARVLP